MTDLAVIRVDIDDELTDVLEAIEATSGKELLLVIPARSLLLASIVNLELLKKKADAQSKTLVLMTKDRIARSLAAEAGIRAFKDDHEMQQYSQSKGVDVSFEDKHEVTHHRNKLDMWAAKVLDFIGVNDASEDSISTYKKAIFHSSKKAFVTIVFFSALVLFAVFFFALPDATITIQPKLAYSPAVANITLDQRETDIEDKVVQIVPIEVTFEKELVIPASGGVFNGQNATGVVTVYNKSQEERSIIGNSRIQTKTGLVFLTNEFITVPGATEDGPGQVQVSVTAREKDAKGNFIGERGNIGPSDFHFPALNESSQKLVYAHSDEAFTGGVTDVDPFVVQEDIDEANSDIVLDLENSAPEMLHKQLTEIPLGSGGDYDIFQVYDKRFVSLELVSVDIPSGIVGKNIETFVVKGKMRAKAYYYNRDDVVNILKYHLTTHQLAYTEELVGMDEQTLKFINIFPPRGSQIKITASMNGLVSYSFDKDDEELIEEIKMSVAGLEKDEAESILQNMPEVDGVEIHLSPMWQKSLPPLRENISITIQESL